jgi:hypothetical protein
MPSKMKFAVTAAIGALVAALALPAAAGAEYYVPPGNSAVNQYTESFPSAGGESGGKKRHAATPAEAIGAGNAKRLKSKGADGHAAAEVAAETAPSNLVESTPPAAPTPDREGDSGNEGDGQAAGGTGGGTGGGGNGGGPANQTGQGNAPDQGGGAPATSSAERGGGSSGLGSVLGQATGLGSGGNLGLWLPLAILAAIGAGAWYRLRPHGQQPAA